MSASTHSHRLIWFCQTEAVSEHPEVLRMLQEEMGLTTIMPESPVCHTSGFSASPALAAIGPFEDWRSRLDRWPRGREGVFPVVAGVVSGFDDRPLRVVLEHCARWGIEVWGHLGLWAYGGEVYPEYALRDLEGRPLNSRYARWGVGLCPNRPQINEAVRAALVEIVQRYGITAFCVDHARYPAPANLSSLLACGCPHCEQAAEALGFPFDRLRRGVLEWLRDMRRIGADRWRALLAGRASVREFLGMLGTDLTLLQWFRCRAALLAARMGEFRQVVRDAAGPDALFGSDVFAPSIALLGGQDYPAWERNTDFLTGGSSHGGVVGWATGVKDLAGTWSAALRATIGGLSEAEAVGLVLRLFGMDDLELPRSRERLDADPLPLVEIFQRELQRLVAGTSGAVPLYPPVSARGNVGTVSRLCRCVRDAGCDGAMLGLDPDRKDTLAEIARHLSA